MHSVDLANIPYLYGRYGNNIWATYKWNGTLDVDVRAYVTRNGLNTAIENEIDAIAKINLPNHLTTNNK